MAVVGGFPMDMQQLVYGDGEIAEGLTEAELDPGDVIPNYSMAKIRGTLFGHGARLPSGPAGGRSGPPRKRARKGKVNYREYDNDDEDDDDLDEEDEEEADYNGIGGTASAEEVQKAESYNQLEQKILIADSIAAWSKSKTRESWSNEKSAYDKDGNPRFDCEILTVVASVNLASHLDLKYIANNSRNVEYNPRRFSPLIMRVRAPKSTALMFSSGKMIVAGTKTKEECKLAVRKYARIIQKLGYEVNYADFEIQNISASGNLRFPIRVHEMAMDPRIKQFVSYEAEIFPGLIYSVVYPKVKAILFVTGAVLMTGAKSEKQVHDALETIYPVARQYIR